MLPPGSKTDNNENQGKTFLLMERRGKVGVTERF